MSLLPHPQGERKGCLSAQLFRVVQSSCSVEHQSRTARLWLRLSGPGAGSEPRAPGAQETALRRYGANKLSRLLSVSWNRKDRSKGETGITKHRDKQIHTPTEGGRKAKSQNRHKLAGAYSAQESECFRWYVSYVRNANKCLVNPRK